MGPIIASGIVVLAMVGISLWGARVLPPGARVPLHYGLGGWGNWQPKALALTTYPVIGLVLCGIVSATASSQPTTGILLPLVMLVMVVGQYRAVAVAIRESGRG